MFNKILAIAAHADDEILGCGGSLIKSKEHPEIAVVWCDDLEQMYRAGKCLELGREQYATCYGVIPYRFFYKFKVRIIAFLEEVIEKVKPDTIFYHFADNHQDHKVVNEAVKAACRRFQGNMFEYLVSRPAVGVEFHPNFYINISDCMKNKLEALSKYSNRINESKTPFDLKSIENWHRYLGMEVGFQYAEAFRMIRGIK